MAFPLLIILISIAADKVLDVDPLGHLDVEAYRQQERKRIAILVERNNFLEQQVEQERRRAEIKQREKDSKRRRRGPILEEKLASPTELEQVMAKLESLQEQIQHLQSPSPLAPLLEHKGQDASRSAEPTSNGHLAETIPTTSWNTEVPLRELETGHTGEAEQRPMQLLTEQQKRSLAEAQLTSRPQAADASDAKQESNQPPDRRVNSKMFAGRTGEEQRRAAQEVPTPWVNGHFDGKAGDHLVIRSPDTAANPGAARGESAERMVHSPFTGHLNEREEQTEKTPEVNSGVKTSANRLPNTAVNSRANTGADSKRLSDKVQVFAEKPRGESSQRVRRVLKKHPTISISQLSEKAKVSRGYASQIRS